MVFGDVWKWLCCLRKLSTTGFMGLWMEKATSWYFPHCDYLQDRHNCRIESLNTTRLVFNVILEGHSYQASPPVSV